MKQFKFLAMIMTLVVMSLGFTACGDGGDDDEPNNPNESTEQTGEIDRQLIGLWVIHEYEEGPSGSFVDTFESFYELWFNMDGTWRKRYEVFDYGSLDQGECSGKFSTTNNKITLVTLDEDGNSTYKTVTLSYKVSGNTLTLDGDVWTKR